MNLIVFFFMLFGPGPKISPLQHVVFSDSDGFRIITTDSIYFTRDGKNFESRGHDFQDEIYRLEPVPALDESKLFVATGGGVVYKFENDSLFRVDQSYRWRSRYGSVRVASNDTIYLFGGYGEFTFYNDLLRFDLENNEWLEIPVSEPRPPRKSNLLLQLDTLSNSVYIGLGSDTHYVGNKSSLRPFYDIGKFDISSREYTLLGYMDFIEEFQSDGAIKIWERFHHYNKPLIYSNKYLFTFDFSKGEAYLHTEADFESLEVYSDVLSYNPIASTFLLGADLANSPRYKVINEADFLGRYYVTYSMKPNNTNSIYFTFFGVFLLVVIVFRLTRKNVLLYDEISKQRKRISSILSKEDDGIFEKILEVYPEFIDYPDLQNAFERDLSYESRIKKLRKTVKEIDQVTQRVLGLKQSVFEIEKGKIDKRVKVIRLKEQSIKITALRYLWPF